MKRNTIAHEWFDEVWNKQQTAAIDRLFAEEGIAHGLVDENGNDIRGPSGFKKFFVQFTKAFPGRAFWSATSMNGSKA